MPQLNEIHFLPNQKIQRRILGTRLDYILLGVDIQPEECIQLKNGGNLQSFSDGGSILFIPDCNFLSANVK